jgi:DNA-binding NarL/FixJ family response regulator
MRYFEMLPRILIADDHEVVRKGVSTLIMRARPHWCICGEARNGNETIDAAMTLNPDVIVLDITMPGLSGLEVARRIVERGARCRIVMFTMHESESLESEVRSVGAHGYVLKSQAGHDLIVAIETILSGGTFYGAPASSKPTRNDKPNPNIAYWPALGLGYV